jgi:Transglutaminase-like superfamily
MQFLNRYGLTIALVIVVLSGSAVGWSDGLVTGVPPEVRSEFGLSEFYSKCVMVGQLPIVGSAKAPDSALIEARRIIELMVGQRREILQELAKAHIRVAIMAAEEQTTDVPEHSSLKPAKYWNDRARGLGATRERPAVSAGAENLLHDENDRYPGECILIHEFAHTIHEMALVELDSTFEKRLQDVFQRAIERGLWKGTYAATNVKEYWAEAVQSYFDSNIENDDQHNHVNTRDELAAYDPEVHSLIESSLNQPEWKYEGRISEALVDAGDNRKEIVKAWFALDGQRRRGLKFLIDNMPEQDLESLTADYLLEHVNLAYEAWEKAPWRDSITEEIFLDGILPYINVNESRDAWRAGFREKFLPVVAECTSSGQAAAKLNQSIFNVLDVRYSTERKRADQGPFESIETHKASCTGLSILLIDACRSVGVPARFVGTPLWSDGSGNHSWVEVWDGGDWHFTGACEPAGDKLDESWFVGRAATANVGDPIHSIYAVSFRRTPIHFPLVWDRFNQSVYAINVTSRYTVNRNEIPAGKIQIRVQLLDIQSGSRVRKRFAIHDANGQQLFEGLSRDDRFDANDHVEVIVDKDQQLTVHVDGQEPVAIQATEAQQLITIKVTHQEDALPK